MSFIEITILSDGLKPGQSTTPRIQAMLNLHGQPVLKFHCHKYDDVTNPLLQPHLQTGTTIIFERIISRINHDIYLKSTFMARKIIHPRNDIL